MVAGKPRKTAGARQRAPETHACVYSYPGEVSEQPTPKSDKGSTLRLHSDSVAVCEHFVPLQQLLTTTTQDLTR